MSKEPKNAVSEISKLIPEAGFDLICRMTPGVIVIVIVWRFTSLITIPQLTWHHLVIAAFFAYLVGMALESFVSFRIEPLSILLSWRVHKKYFDDNEIERIWKLVNVESNSKQINEQDGTRRQQNGQTPDFNAYENKQKWLELFRGYVKKVDPTEAMLFVKITAEERIMKTSALGFPLCLVIIFLLRNICLSQFVCSLTWQDILLFIIIEAILILGVLYRIERTNIQQIRLFKGSERKDSAGNNS